MRSLAVLAAVIVALVAGAARAGTGSAGASQHAIVVGGDGTVTAAPDRGTVAFGVSTGAKTASGALHADAIDMVKVIAALKAQGIAAADIRTDVVSLSIRYSSSGNDIVGYTASNSVEATLRSLDKTGGVIDTAVEAGANEVTGPNLARGDVTALYRRALRAAITNAKGKAETIAAASGLHLRRITDVTENSSSPPGLDETVRASAPAVPSTPIEPGTQTVDASVTVTFAVS